MTSTAIHDAFVDADRTSIVRVNRLPVAAALLEKLGWGEGQRLSGRITPDGLEIAAAADGNLRLLPPGVIVGSEIQRAGLRPGDVAAFKLTGKTLLATGVDGREHESYRTPRRDESGMPVPPSWLAQAFTSKPDSSNFVAGGARVAAMLVGLLDKAGLMLNAGSRVLDFGCGAARVARPLHEQTGTDVVGYDLHAAAIDWCRAQLPFGRWEYGRQTPPLTETGDTFDAVIAISVLTHLDAHHQDLWLAEWKRLLRRGGILIVTFKSEHFLEKVMKPKSAEYAEKVARQLAGGSAYIKDNGWVGVFPDYYQDAFYTIDDVKARWSRDFEIVGLHLPGTLPESRQDLAVLRKP